MTVTVRSVSSLDAPLEDVLDVLAGGWPGLLGAG